MRLERFQIYAVCGLIIFFFTLLMPRQYPKVKLANLMAENKVAQVFPLPKNIEHLEQIGNKIPLPILNFGNKVMYFQGLPLWRIILDAPQYPRSAFPQGLLVDVFPTGPFNGCSGSTDCLHEIDTINHYIGMQPLTIAAPIESKLSPYFALFVIIGVILFILNKKRMLGIFVFLPIAVPFIFMIVFSFWTHWLGYHLSKAPFTVHSFTPVIYGIGKVAQFVTRNRPAYGFSLLMFASILFALAYFSKQKYLLKQSMEKS